MTSVLASPDVQPENDSGTRDVAGVELQLGDVVEDKGYTGVVRYMGTTLFKPGIWVGLELDEPAGLNDGSKDGQRYFRCNPRHGKFIRAGRLKFLSRPGVKRAGSANVRADVRSPSGSPFKAINLKAGVTGSATPDSPFISPEGYLLIPGMTPIKLERHILSPPRKHDAPPLKVGDRIKDNKGYLGYVRFLGFTDFLPGEWVGIELDEAKGKNDGYIRGVRYFKCEPLHGRFVRPHNVEKYTAIEPPIVPPLVLNAPATPEARKPVPIAAPIEIVLPPAPVVEPRVEPAPVRAAVAVEAVAAPVQRKPVLQPKPAPVSTPLTNEKRVIRVKQDTDSPQFFFRTPESRPADLELTQNNFTISDADLESLTRSRKPTYKGLREEPIPAVAISARTRRLAELDAATVDVKVTALRKSGRLNDDTLSAALRITLKTLDVSYTEELTDISLRRIGNVCKNLTSINLTECTRVTDRGLFALVKGCKKLKTIYLKGCILVTDIGVIEVVESSPWLESLDLSWLPEVGDASLRAIAEHLQEALTLDLDLAGNDTITDHGIAELCRMRGKQLRAINLGYCSNLTDISLEALAQHCGVLERVSVEGNAGLTPRALVQLIENRWHVRELILAGCAVDDDVVRRIAKAANKNLKLVDVSDCPEVGASIASLARACSSLRYLSVSGTNVDATGIAAVRRHCPKLVTLIAMDCPRLTTGILEELRGDDVVVTAQGLLDA